MSLLKLKLGARKKPQASPALRSTWPSTETSRRCASDRLLPPRRHEPVTLDVADTIAATSAIVAAVAAGDLTAAEAADLAKVVDVHVQALATAAFEGAPGPAGTKSRALIPRAAVGRPVCKARTLVAFAV